VVNMTVKTDLQKAYAYLTAKQVSYVMLWAYYDGNHPLVYSTERLEQVFRSIKGGFVENWCSVVVDSVLERLDLVTVGVANNDAATGVIENLWMVTELDLDEESVHRAALVTGEAFVVAWKDEDKDIEAYYINPSLIHVQYDPENPRTKLWAAKWWEEESGHWQLTLYYPDRLEYYRTLKAEPPKTANAFQPMDDPQAENPTGIIPVFHFRRERRDCSSELQNVIPIQKAINKLLADMMISAEFGAMTQRWIISGGDTTKLKNMPGEIWDIPAGDGQSQPASVGQLNSTPFQNFLDAIDDLVGAVSAISRTPHHHFFGKGEVPSGEALIALEAPLNKKCNTYIKRFKSVWRQLAAFLLELAGTKVDANSITVGFARPETVQPKMQAEIRQMGTLTGIPLTTILRQEGWTGQQLEQLEKDKQDETANQQNSLAKALMAQQRNFDQGEE